MQLYATCRPFPERASVLGLAVGLVAWNRGSCRVVRIASFCGRFAAGIEGASPQEKRKAVAGFQPAQAPRQRGNFRRLKTCGHFGRHAARCLHVGAGFQPAHEPPWAWTHRRLKTCGHFGQPAATLRELRPLRTVKKRRHGRHPRGCRPRSGACVTLFSAPGLPLLEPLRAGARLRLQSGLPRFGGCHLFPRRFGPQPGSLWRP